MKINASHIIPTAVPDLDEQMLGVKRNSEHVDVTEGEESQPAAKGRSRVGRTGVRRHKWAERDGRRQALGEANMPTACDSEEGTQTRGVGEHGQRRDGGIQGDTEGTWGDMDGGMGGHMRGHGETWKGHKGAGPKA